MIRIFNQHEQEIKTKQDNFPDGTQLIRVNQDALKEEYLTIRWDYETEGELATLIFITRHLQENSDAKLILEMPYIPNARMDRINHSDEIFTLKYFAQTINDLHFYAVRVLDPHSNVSKALLNNLFEMNVNLFIQNAIDDYEPDVLFMPDEGAHKRYSTFFNLPSTFGIKLRDWRTGEIKDYHLADPEMIKDKRVLIIDDISSRGNTFYHAGMLLHKEGAKAIGLYVTHCEKTIANGFVLDPEKSHIDTVYTADPLWHTIDDDPLWHNTDDYKLNRIKIIK